MPFRYEERVSPKGRPYVWLHVSGELSVADANEYASHFRAGGRYHRMHTLSFVEKGTEYGPEARRIFLEVGQSAPHATVTSSALVRAAINLMSRFSPKTGRYRMFATEPEALAWLDDKEA